MATIAATRVWSLSVGAEVGDEAAVDLDLVDGEALEVGRATSSRCRSRRRASSTPSVAERGEDVGARVASSISAVSVISRHSCDGSMPVAVELGGDLVDEAGVAQLAGRTR